MRRAVAKLPHPSNLPVWRQETARSACACRVLPWPHSLISMPLRGCYSTYRNSFEQTTPINQTKHFSEPTIYALSTAPGRAAIAVIRISGIECIRIYHALCPNTKLPKPRYAAVRSIYEARTAEAVTAKETGKGKVAEKGMERVKGKLLDSAALILFFPSPNTVTGEDILEFHVHGGPAVVKAVLAAIGSCNSNFKSTNTERSGIEAGAVSIRYAEPGEFTRRAFANDRMDLTQIEALGDTLNAVTEEQRQLSVNSAIGTLTKRYEEWRRILIYARGELEALIDFSEDQHFDESPSVLAKSVARQVRGLMEGIECSRRNAVRGELLRSGIGVSLLGAPNVGKSSLLNLVVGREAAIVSRDAGTTRDVVEVGLDLGGFFCRFGDTAGLRTWDGNDVEAVKRNVVGEVELEGIKRAKAKAVLSDVVLLVLSVESSIDGQGVQLFLDKEVLETAKDLLEQKKSMIVVVNKMDRYGEKMKEMAAQLSKSIHNLLPTVDETNIYCISCRQAESSKSKDEPNPGNIQNLLAGIIRTFKSITSPLFTEFKGEGEGGGKSAGLEQAQGNHGSSIWQESLGATERQRILLDTCHTHLQHFLDQVDITTTKSEAEAEMNENREDVDIVVAAESLRKAADSLARIIGRGDVGDVEEVLGVVFEKFCVGK